MAAELGLSEQQKAQVKEIFRKGMAGSEPIMTRLITERRNLRALVQADKIDEAAIRAQAAKLADIEGDLAIQRARMAGQIRAILTPAQVEKFKACQLAKEKKFDNLRERMHRRFENITTSK
ncbi:MAG TPA: Spy/CpxP family protein refolding chaperone [Geobacteraceae bacterium]